MLNYIRKLLILDIPEDYKQNLKKELVQVNFVRTRNLSILLFVVFAILLITDYMNYSQGLWDEVPGYRLLFFAHLFLELIIISLLSYIFLVSLKLKTIPDWHKQWFVGLLTYTTLIGATLVSIADQYIHGGITVFVLCCLLFAIINYQKPLFNLILYSTVCIIFISGITIVQENPNILKGHYLNGTSLVILALFLSRILYSAKVNDFNSKMTIEQQNDELELANHELSAINQELEASLHALDESQNIIFSLTLTLESKDMNTHGHSERVGEYAMALARQLDLNDKDRTNLWRAAILHDIGKVGIPDAILNKPSALNQDEWDIMRSHPVRGEVICSKLRFAQEILPIIRYHHERYDGNGYPDGLKGDEIPFLARVVSIADTVDAMTSPRSYRTQPRTMDEAMEELKRCSGTQFDPLLVDAFLQIYRSDAVNQISKPLVSDYTIKAH